MKKIAMGLFSAAVLAQSAGASELTTRIVDVQLTKAGDEAMIYEEGGRILRVKANEKAFVKALKNIKHSNQFLRVDFDEKSFQLNGAQLLEQAEVEVAPVTAAESYTPSEITMEEATAAFSAMDNKTKSNSQCFNRAHGWAYDMFSQRDIKSMKMFIFFTRKYIEEHKYNWWFHVAPYVIVKNETGTEERLMDRSFTKGPETVKKWTDRFIKTKINCTVAAKYTDFHSNQFATDCYLIKASMYYRSPKDLELLEKENRQEVEWNAMEIREARKQAFKNWRDYNP